MLEADDGGAERLMDPFALTLEQARPGRVVLNQRDRPIKTRRLDHPARPDLIVGHRSSIRVRLLVGHKQDLHVRFGTVTERTNDPADRNCLPRRQESESGAPHDQLIVVLALLPSRTVA